MLWDILLVIGVLTGCVLLVGIAMALLLRGPASIHQYAAPEPPEECFHLVREDGKVRMKRCTCEYCEVSEKVIKATPEEIFFDEKDVSVTEAHAEYPDFHGTVVEINGIKVGKDGMIPEEPKRRSWWRR